MLENNNFSAFDNLNLDIKQNLLKYATIRVDLKNSGLNNDIKLVGNSPYISYKSYPDWFCDEKGKGLVLHSYNGFIDLKVKYINQGCLRIAIRGIHFLDKNEEKFPIYVNIEEFYLNGDLMLQNKLVWHDDPYIFFKDVEDSEIVHIKLKWLPLNKSSEFKNSLKLKNESLKKENNKLKSDLKRSNNQKTNFQKNLNEYKEENFNLLVNLEKVAKENYVLKKELNELKKSERKKHSFRNTK